MEQAAVEKRIAHWFLARRNIEISAPELDLFESGALDSLGFVELLLHLEQDFGISIALEQVELDHFRSVARIATFLLNGAATAHVYGR